MRKVVFYSSSTAAFVVVVVRLLKATIGQDWLGTCLCLSNSDEMRNRTWIAGLEALK